MWRKLIARYLLLARAILPLLRHTRGAARGRRKSPRRLLGLGSAAFSPFYCDKNPDGERPAFWKAGLYAAVFLLANGNERTVRFGTASNYVSNPRKTARDRAAYIARHRVNENHNDPLTPGALSRWLLWGESRSLARNTAAFRRRFRLQ